MKLRHFLKLSAFLATGLTPLHAESFLIKDARIITVSGSAIERGSVLVVDGRISAVGETVSAPRGVREIDARGLTVYPGLFDANTRLGLTEIGQVAVSNDFRELGEYTPHLMAFSALHPDSDLIPVSRVDGVTHVLSRPTGGVIAGQAAVISLEGWIPEELDINRHGAMILDFPSLLPLRAGRPGQWGAPRPFSEIRKEYDDRVLQLKELLARARHYARNRKAGLASPYRQLEALVPVVERTQVILIEADSHVDIRNAVEFAEEENLLYAILGASDAWRVADFLKERGVRVILGPRQSLPVREDDPIDVIYRTPAILHEKGVPFAISTANASDVRTLPFEVGNAVAYGLPWEAGLRSVTLTPAEILGIADQVGSIEVGKRANLVIADGDLLEYQTNIRYLFINGKPVSLESRHTRLYRRYLERP